MKIYDEITKEELTAPDESKGYLYESQIKTGMTEDTYEVMEGTVTEDCPNGLRRLIPGHAVFEACQFYHTYTDEEIKRMEEQAAAEQAAKEAAEREAAEKAAKEAAEKEAQNNVNSSSTQPNQSQEGSKPNHPKETDGVTVYTTPSGKCYHLDPDCGGKNSRPTTLTKAQSSGYRPCEKCA